MAELPTASTWFPTVDGLPGKSAYEIAVDEGFLGSEAQWLATLIGPQGEQGEQGETGEQGIQGDPGTNGTNGTDGADGLVLSVVAGTGIAVDDTDPANPIVSATGGGGGGGFSLLPSPTQLAPNDYADAAFAFRGNEVFARADLDVLGLVVPFAALAGDSEQYKAVAFRVTRSSDLVHEVYESQVLAPPVGTNDGEALFFEFDSPVPCRRQTGTTQAWLFGVLRIDGAGTDPCRIGRNSNFVATLWNSFTVNGSATKADNTVPVVDGNYVTNAGSGHFPFFLIATFPSI